MTRWKPVPIAPPGMKTCRGCMQPKTLDQFLASRTDPKTGRVVLRSRCRTCGSATATAWQKANPERTKRQKKTWRLQSEYGISLEEYEALLVKQNSKCALCGIEESRSHLGGGNYMLCVDHCHDTGAIRGLLCNNCNRGLGFLGDRIETLEGAIRYLKEGSE